MDGVLTPLSSVLRHLLVSVEYGIKWIIIRGNGKIRISTPLPFYVITQQKILYSYFHSNISETRSVYYTIIMK